MVRSRDLLVGNIIPVELDFFGCLISPKLEAIIFFLPFVKIFKLNIVRNCALQTFIKKLSNRFKWKKIIMKLIKPIGNCAFLFPHHLLSFVKSIC